MVVLGKVNVFGKNCCIPAKLVLIGKVVVFGKVVVIGQKLLCSGKSCCIRVKEVEFE